ncbi:WG repeat-containing protein [Brevibacillus ruminantium]|uniref:WG repeat-containing protein n=1 Tax=Brevibacillus ruminantium TaxID=2950604 RepID=A0ABY4WIG9_9BACL|nr:WG repeat-containing protein [Brevibacillus ruminantium]USG66945.1 WG repeat-containing protein [Brevibacillus ruminantium]
MTKNGKKGIVDGRTGKEVVAAIWDDIEIPEQKQIAILRSGGWFQYMDLGKQALSKTKYAGAHTYFLSQTRPSVIVMQGESSMMLDPAGTILLPPFAGKIEVVDLAKPGENPDDESIRYLVTTTPGQLTVYDPNTLKPLFSVPKATLAPSDGNKMSVFKVVTGGKYGLVDLSGRYLLQPQFTSIQSMGKGFVRVQGQQGAGLWKDGKMLAEPQYADVRIEHDMLGGFITMKGETVTYHDINAGTSFSLKKGAHYLHDGYVLGQDPVTSKYGVKHISGKTVVPFDYPRLEGVPAMWLLVRPDGKKGILRTVWGQPVQQPDAWFDSVTTLGGYEYLSVMEGNKVGLYSQQKGMLVPPQAGTVIRYDSKFNRVLVTDADGRTREFLSDGTSADSDQPKLQPLTSSLATTFIPDQGIKLVDRTTGQPISKAYRGISLEAKGQLVLALEDGAAYSPPIPQYIDAAVGRTNPVCSATDGWQL